MIFTVLLFVKIKNYHRICTYLVVSILVFLFRFVPRFSDDVYCASNNKSPTRNDGATHERARYRAGGDDRV